jgi:hypothetical protein
MHLLPLLMKPQKLKIEQETDINKITTIEATLENL